MDAEPSLLRVYDGEAEVINGAKTITAHKGRQVQLDDTLVATTFDTKDTDSTAGLRAALNTSLPQMFPRPERPATLA